MERGALGEEEPARGASWHTFIYHLNSSFITKQIVFT